MAAVSSKIDEVSRNSIWEEAIRKENRALKLNSEFAIGDPRKMVIITEKPNRIVPSSNPDPQVILEATRALAEFATIKDGDRTPSEKFALPLTSNMEYGFMAQPLVKQGSKFDHRAKDCDVTSYANQYVKMAGTSPYARKDGPASNK